MKPKIYVAGPYSKGDVMENIRNAIGVGQWLLDKGFTPFVPHLTGFWHVISSNDYETWLSYDFEWIKACSALLRLPGESSGADREVEFARSNDIPVFYDREALYNFYKETL